MNNQRKELANLFARYLDGTLAEEDTTAVCDRLHKSDDPTIANGYQILINQIDNTMFDAELLEKPEWDYLERIRLALLGDAKIVKRKTLHFGWRNLLSGIGFFSFVMIATHYEIGYHLLPVTACFGLAIFAFSKLFPKVDGSSPFQSILAPFDSFSDLRRAYAKAGSFKKQRYKRQTEEQGSLISKCFWILIASCIMAVLSPVLLLMLIFPDTEPKYHVTVQ